MFVEGLREKARVGFDSWLQQETDSERICCVTGPLGSGKTTLAAEFCGVEPDGEGTRDVKRQKRECEEEDRLITAFYFFQGDENLALNKCWAKVGRQLAGRLGYDLVGGVSTEEDSLFVFRRFVAEPLTRLSKPSNKIVILVDGVDKLPWEEQESFWEIVSQTWERETPMWVHLAVFSYTALRLSGTIRWVDLQDEDHEKDIELFCNARLASFMQDEEDVQYATKHIVRHSTERPSVLLYTSCVLDALLEGRSHRSVTLDDIWEMEWRPDCLAHAFRPSLIHFLDHVMDGDVDRYHQLLSCLSAARTPLSIDVAAEALEMNNESLKALVSRSTSLVYQEGDVIKFAHPCLQDVVQHRRCGKHPDGSPLQVKARRGHEWFVHFLEHNKTSSLALHDLIYHLCCARKWDAVRDHLLDFDWVLALVSEEGCALKLIEDTDKLYNDKPHADVNATDVVRAIDLGLEAILADSALLKQQIIGRIPDETHPIRRSYEASLFAQTERAKLVFLPVAPTLLPARSTFRKRLRVDGQIVCDVGATNDERFLVLRMRKGPRVLWDTLSDTYILPYEDFKEYSGYMALTYEETCIDWRFGKLLFDYSRAFSNFKRERITSVVLCNGMLAVEFLFEDDVDTDRTLAVIDVSKKIGVFTLYPVKEVFSCFLKEDFLFLMADHPDERDFGFERVYTIWSFQSGQCIFKYTCERKRYSPKLRLLSVSGDKLFVNDNQPSVWNWKSGNLETTLPNDDIRLIDLSRNLFAVGTNVFDIKSNSFVTSLPGRKTMFARDSIISSTLWANQLTWTIHHLNISQEQTVWPLEKDSLTDVWFVYDDVVLASCGDQFHLWDASSGAILRTLDCAPILSQGTKGRILFAMMDSHVIVCVTTLGWIMWDKNSRRAITTTHEKRVFSGIVHDDRIIVCCESQWPNKRHLIKEYHLRTAELIEEFIISRPDPGALSISVLPHRLLFRGDSLRDKGHVISYKTGDTWILDGQCMVHGTLLSQKKEDIVSFWDLRTLKKVANFPREKLEDSIYVRLVHGVLMFAKLDDGNFSLQLSLESTPFFRVKLDHPYGSFQIWNISPSYFHPKVAIAGENGTVHVFNTES